MLELQMSGGSVEVLERALALARHLVELPFDLNLWQAQNIWYEILGTSSHALTTLQAEDRLRWDKSFSELASCLSIDFDNITADDVAVASLGD
jgi:hypothetical protein